MSQHTHTHTQSALVWFIVHYFKGYSLTLFRLISKEIKWKADLLSPLNLIFLQRHDASAQIGFLLFSVPGTINETQPHYCAFSPVLYLCSLMWWSLYLFLFVFQHR